MEKKRLMKAKSSNKRQEKRREEMKEKKQTVQEKRLSMHFLGCKEMEEMLKKKTNMTIYGLFICLLPSPQLSNIIRLIIIK